MCLYEDKEYTILCFLFLIPYTLLVLSSVSEKHRSTSTTITSNYGNGREKGKECALTLEGFTPEILRVLYTHISLAIRVKFNPTL